MKKLFLTIALLSLFTFTATAQNKSIAFEETKVWKEIVEKAKKENKLIFVDCYTDWCGPCKILAARVFTQNHVADFFNEKFVNAKFEMEKDTDGIVIKEKWAINAYPTLLFVDPVADKVVHRMVGAGQADWLVEGGKVAMDPTRNLGSLVERYEAGERSPKFMVTYLKALSSGLMKAEQNKVVTEYFNGMTADQLATSENWELIRTNVSDPMSELIRIVIDNPGKFYAIEGVDRDAVDQHLTALLMDGATVFTSKKVPFDKTRLDEVSSYYSTINMPAVEPAVFYLRTVGKSQSGDWRGVLADIKKVIADKDILGQRYSSGYENAFLPMLGKSGDRTIIGEAIGILDARMEVSNLYSKPYILDQKSDLLRAMGDDAAADEIEVQADEFRRQVQEEIDRNTAGL